MRAGRSALVLCVALGGCASNHDRQPSRGPDATPPAASVETGEAPLQSSAKPSERFVSEPTDVYLGPNLATTVTNRLDRGQRVAVYEERGGWARISEPYNGAVEGVAGEVARWVPVKSLSAEPPAPQPRQAIADDPRVDGIPRVGQGGLTERDVLVLHAAARYYLETGRATRVDFGDKSVDKPGVYYLNFGGYQNHFFRTSDIPDLERRIDSLSP